MTGLLWVGAVVVLWGGALVGVLLFMAGAKRLREEAPFDPVVEAERILIEAAK